MRAVTQGSEEMPATFLEWLMEAYHLYTPYDPMSPDQRGNVSMVFIWQSAPDIRNNKWVEDIHVTVPNPYNLLSTLTPTHSWYTILDLKDAFFCLKLSPQSQPLFAMNGRTQNRGSWDN